ncbi:nucleotide exchange factor GrpE [Paludibacterium paludis]|uniref:Protein GrpE n=1 Tax=Paludibacterium paludis TaxID=1225769 RepID=A0A918P5C3_9NEIS|nr:nucleotide exchange factor GrpE [Paludibacterium paludis]GGY21550.1 protein GrpE [Paludibacterium paludis]
MQEKETSLPEEHGENTVAPETGSESPVADTSPDTAAEPTAEQRIAELEAELAQVKDQYLRSLADLENQRRRASEDVASAHKFAINKLAAELFPVKDSLEMALADQSGQFDNLKFGVDLTLKQLLSAFEKAQIKEINPLGEMLDPHRHQAISMEESEAEPNSVIRVMQKGYMVAERVLRPAMVVVAKAK